MAGGQDSGGYRVDEFDVEDPHRAMHDVVDKLIQAADAGRGDELVKEMREKGADTAANMAEAFMQERKGAFLTLTRTTNKAAEAGDLAGALAIVDRTRAEGALTAEQALYMKEDAYERVGDLEAALEAHEEWANAEPRATMEYRSKAELLYRLGRTGELEEWCGAWEGSRHDRTGLYLNRARLMYARGDADGARRHISAMLTLEKFNPEAHELRGDMLADAGDLRGAILRYNRALDLDYNIIYPHIKKAEALMRMGRPDSAALACRRGLKIRPANPRLRDILEKAGGPGG